jgi:hypothetical protein
VLTLLLLLLFSLEAATAATLRCHHSAAVGSDKAAPFTAIIGFRYPCCAVGVKGVSEDIRDQAFL